MEASQLLEDLANDSHFLSIDGQTFGVDDPFRQSRRMSKQQMDQKDKQR